MKSSKSSNRAKFIIALGVVFLVAAGVVLYSNMTAEEQPPSLKPSSANLKGLIFDEGVGFLQFTEEDVENFVEPSIAAKTLEQGIHYYYLDTEKSVQDIIDLIEPVEDMKIVIAYYDSYEGQFYTYKENYFENTKEIRNPRNFTIPADVGFVIIASKESRIWDVMTEKEKASYEVGVNIDEGWVLKPIKNEQIYNEIQPIRNKVQSLWVQKGEDRFEKADADTAETADYYLAWVKVGEVSLLCEDGEEPFQGVCVKNACTPDKFGESCGVDECWLGECFKNECGDGQCGSPSNATVEIWADDTNLAAYADAKQCTTCTSSETCLVGSCVDATCDPACGNNQVCLFDQCLNVEDGEILYNGVAVNVRIDEECGDGIDDDLDLLVDGADREIDCTSQTETEPGECSSDSDCVRGSFCKDGECVEDFVDCGIDKEAFQGLCVKNPCRNFPHSQTYNGDKFEDSCDVESCYFGECFVNDLAASGQCGSPYNKTVVIWRALGREVSDIYTDLANAKAGDICELSETCITGQCVATKCNPDCASDEVCLYSECWTVTNTGDIVVNGQAINSKIYEDCDNGLDDDFDGLVDSQDRECRDDQGSNEDSEGLQAIPQVDMILHKTLEDFLPVNCNDSPINTLAGLENCIIQFEGDMLPKLSSSVSRVANCNTSLCTNCDESSMDCRSYEEACVFLQEDLLPELRETERNIRNKISKIKEKMAGEIDRFESTEELQDALNYLSEEFKINSELLSGVTNLGFHYSDTNGCGKI